MSAGDQRRTGPEVGSPTGSRKGTIEAVETLVILVLGVIVLGLLLAGLFYAAGSLERWSRRVDEAPIKALEAWTRTTPDWQLPPVVIRVYDGTNPQAGARRFQQEASLLSTRGYAVASTSAGSYGGPGVGSILAFGLLAFGQGRQSNLTVTYSRQGEPGGW